MDRGRKIVLVRASPGVYQGVLGARLPLALLRVASTLHEDHPVVIIDQAQDRRWRRRLREELSTGDTLAVGLGTMTGPQLGHAIDISRTVRQAAPKVPIVWGGVHPSLFPEQVARSPLVDYAVVGEGEITLAELVQALEGQGDPSSVLGLAYEDGGDVVRTGPRPFVDLDSLPPLPLSLVDFQGYLCTDFGVSAVTEYESSRGCPHDCDYCYNKTYNRRHWRAFSAERVVEEMADLHRRFGVRGFFFVDDEFFVDLKRARAILEGVLQRGLDLRLSFQGGRIDSFRRMDDETLRLLARCGAHAVQFGLESGSARILDFIDKNFDREDVLALNRRLARVGGIRPYYNFLLGFPGETRDEIDESVRLGWQLLRDNPLATLGVYHILTPYPGSALFDRAVAEGFSPPANLDGWARLDWGKFDLHANWSPWLSPEDHEYAQRVAAASLFVDDKVAQRTTSRARRLAASLYRPIARARFSWAGFDRMPERVLFDRVLR
jgi:anaerobic magnesium-protoporphyrin IX monomethyl ester cyclase